MSFKRSQNIFAKIFLGGVFAFSMFVFAPEVRAQVILPDELNPGGVSTCGELAVSGTYTIAEDFNADFTAIYDACFYITADNVTINGANHTITTSIRDLAIDARKYAGIAGDTESGLLAGANAYTGLQIQNLTVSDFTTSINANGNNITDGLGGNGGNITITSSTLTNITANGGNGTDSDGGIGGNITISDDSIVGDITSSGGVYNIEWQASLQQQNFKGITSTPNGDVYAIESDGDIYKQAGGQGAFEAQNVGGMGWMSIVSTSNGDVYAIIYSGDIYKLDYLNPQDGFVAQGAENQDWYSITSAPSGDVYVVANGGDIYKQTGGQGEFVAQNAGNQSWYSITSTPDGDVYAVAYGDDIYKLDHLNPQNGFVAQGAGSLGWYGITSAPNGDVYATVSGDDIYKLDHLNPQNGFVAQGAGTRNWNSITSTPSGDIYVAASVDDIYKLDHLNPQNGFVAQGAGSLGWYGITFAPNGDVYAFVESSSFYKQILSYSLGGTITVNNSQIQNITAQTINITGDDIDISNNTYTADTFDITYTNTLATTNTSLVISSHFIVNEDDFGPYTGDFPLLPGLIDSCATLALPGTYTLTNDITDVSGTCFNIQSDNITIDGDNHTISALTSTTTPAIDARRSEDGASAFTNTTIQNLTISNFTTSINSNGNSISSGQGGYGGNITITASNLTNITANGGNGTDSNGGIGGNITISDDSSVGEVSSEGGVGSYSAFEAQNAGNQYWSSITSTPNGDLYAVALEGDIYKQTAGQEELGFVAQNVGNYYWQSITSTLSGDVYAVTLDDIYKQTADQEELGFVAQNAGDYNWIFITSTPSGDVYAVVNGGDIYKQTGGQGEFVAQNAGNQYWASITSTPSGDVYAVVNGGDIYKLDYLNPQDGFVAQNTGNQYWISITSTLSGDVYAVVNGGDIYKQTGGQGEFVAQNAGNYYWQSITSTLSGDVYVATYEGDIYKQTAGQEELGFVAQNAGNLTWWSIISTLSDDVYAVTIYDDIYKQTAFHSLGGTITIDFSLTQNVTGETINISGMDMVDIRDNVYTATNAIVIDSPTIQTNNSTYIYTGIGDFLVNNATYTYPIGSEGYNGVYNPVVYYFTNIIDTDWNTLANWCTGSYCGDEFAEQAARLPSSVDQVIINGNVLSNSGSDAVADTVVFTNTSTNAISINATRGVTYTDSSSLSATTTSPIISFEDTASLVGKVYTSVARFYNDASSAVLGTIRSIGASGPFEPQNTGSQNWYFITSAPNGDVYASKYSSGDDYIFKLDHLNPQDGFVAHPETGSKSWTSITSTPSGDVYAVADGGDIYKQTGGQGEFQSQNIGNLPWKSITSAPNGDVYAVAQYDGIYKQAAGQEQLGFVFMEWSENWTSITSTSNGDVYVTALGYPITKKPSGQTDFLSQESGMLDWTSITSAPNGDVYAIVNGGDIYKQTGGQGAFVAQNAGNQNWTSITSTPNGDVYAVTQAGGWGQIYKKETNGDWNMVLDGTQDWTSITSTPNGDVYVAALNDDIYKRSALAPTAERIYTESSTTTRDFTTEGGVDTWTVIAQRAVGSLVDVVVNITGAIYDLTKNIFKAFTGATFISGTDINNLSTPVVPELIPILPIQNQTVTKWLPSVDWGDTATICEYSYDNWTTTDIATCSNNGSDISRPLGGSHTLTLRSTNEYGSFKEEAIEFTYDNTVPTYTMCGSDLLDESTRPYYYLSENTTGDCTATVNTELRGTSNTNATSTGYTLTGNMIANAKNISLKFINITGTVTTSGTSNGQSAGNITIATSTTGAVYANGANGTGNGGNGGDITITNSISSPLLSAIFANGGDSTSCGNGGDSGEVTLTNSSYGTITNDPGSEENSGCPSSSKTSGTKRNQNVTGTYTAPGSSNNNNNNNNVSTESVSKGGYSKNFIPGQINKVIVPVQDITPLKFTPLPSFGTGENPFSFIAPIQKFLNSPMPQAFDNKFQYTPSLAEYIKSIGINSSQALINIQNIPKTLSPEAYEIPGVWKAYTKGIPVRNSDGQFTQISNITVSSALAGNTSNLIYQTIKVSPRINITVSLKSDLSESKGSFNGRDIYFRKEGDRLVADITVPRASGTYYVSTGATPIDLAIQVIDDTPTTIIDQVKPATIWGKIRSFFGW